MKIKTTQQFEQQMKRRHALLNIRPNGTGFISFLSYHERHEVPAAIVAQMKPHLIDCDHSRYCWKSSHA